MSDIAKPYSSIDQDTNREGVLNHYTTISILIRKDTDQIPISKRSKLPSPSLLFLIHHHHTSFVFSPLGDPCAQVAPQQCVIMKKRYRIKKIIRFCHVRKPFRSSKRQNIIENCKSGETMLGLKAPSVIMRSDQNSAQVKRMRLWVDSMTFIRKPTLNSSVLMIAVEMSAVDVKTELNLLKARAATVCWDIQNPLNKN